MKFLLSMSLIAMSFSALASTVTSQTFIYDGSQNSVVLDLQTEKTHTEYRYEDRVTTCYREELVGYRTVCTGGYGPGYPRPYPGPGPGYPYPYPGPGYRQCYQEPIYRQVPYTCTRTDRISFEVKDYDVDARVIVDVTKISPEATPGEKITVTLNGDVLSFNAEGSKKFFIVKKKQDIRSSMNGSVKMIDGLLAIELVEAAPILKAVSMSKISMKNSVLNFDIGRVADRANIGFSLKIEKQKVLASDSMIFDRELLDSEVELNATANGATAGVNVSKLGVELKKGKFEITAKAFAKVGGSIMNALQFGKSLEASKMLVYKVK